MLLTWKLDAEAMEHARNLDSVHPAVMSMWASSSLTYQSADQGYLFDDAVFASVMDGAKCDIVITLLWFQ